MWVNKLVLFLVTGFVRTHYKPNSKSFTLIEGYCPAPIAKGRKGLETRRGYSTAVLGVGPRVSYLKLCLIICGYESMYTILPSKLQIPGTSLLLRGGKGLWFSKTARRERENKTAWGNLCKTLIDTGQKTRFTKANDPLSCEM